MTQRPSFSPPPGHLMRSSKSQPLFVATVLVLCFGWAFRVPAMYAWMRHTGSVAAHGTASWSEVGKPATVLTGIGHTPHVGETEISAPSVGAYHVLVLFSADSLTARNDWNITLGSVGQGVSQAWNVWSGEPGHERAVRRELSTRYDGFLRGGEMGGRRYALRDGNLFVVRYD